MFIELCCSICVYEGRHRGHKYIKLDDTSFTQDPFIGTPYNSATELLNETIELFNRILQKTRELKKKIEDEINASKDFNESHSFGINTVIEAILSRDIMLIFSKSFDKAFFM